MVGGKSSSHEVISESYDQDRRCSLLDKACREVSTRRDNIHVAPYQFGSQACEPVVAPICLTYLN